MSGKGFSITRIVLVVVLLGALLWAGRLVNGPVGAPKKGDDDHDAPAQGQVAKAPPPDMEKIKKLHADEEANRKKMAKEQADRAALAKKLSGGRELKDPTTTDISSDYWNKNKMGQDGLKEMDVKLAKEKAEYDRIQAKVKAASPAPDMKAPAPPGSMGRTAP